MKLDLDDVTTEAPRPTAAPAEQAALRTHTWRELVQGERRTIAYHWPGWIPLATVALLVGAGETYKSWLALTLAVMTAAGRVLFARDNEGPLYQGSVLYLSAENSIEEEQRRCQLLQSALGLAEDLPITFVAAEALNLSHEADYAQIVALLEQTPPALVVVDSAIAVSGVAEERDNSAVRAFMQRRVFPLARQHRATVLVIGHSPKPPREAGSTVTDEHVARGAGDWRNASDVVLYLRREPSLGAQAVILRHAKLRIGRRAAPLWFTLDEDVATGGVALTLGGAYDETTAQASGVLAKAVAGALAALRAAPAGLTVSDLAKQVSTGPPGTTRRTARRAVDVLRGKPGTAWPAGPHAGQPFAVVDEAKVGRSVRLLLDPTRVAAAASPPPDDDGAPA